MELSDRPVLAHNIGFAARVLRRSFESGALPQPRSEFRCTETLARAAFRLPSIKVTHMAEYVGLAGFAAHSAGDVALTCARIVLAIAQQ
jgi:DNA polymerase III epsilon subunit-like protein